MGELLREKVSIVTGAASGNGRAIAKTFAEHGSDVVVADLQSEPREGGHPTHEWIQEETDARATFVECDVTKPSDIDDATARADELGGLDVMVNNAGIFRDDDFIETSLEAYEIMMDINVKGVFLGAQAAAEKWRAEGTAGTIVNMSSSAGIRGSSRSAVYSTSKGAVRLLTYSLATELGPAGIRVNAIHPGLIETQMTTEDVPIFGDMKEEMYLEGIPLGRAGTPEDVANAALFLASDLASYVNGESLYVDGGMINAL